MLSLKDVNIIPNTYNSNYLFFDEESAQEYINFCKKEGITTSYNEKARKYFEKKETVKFDISKDLLPCDKIRRRNNNGLHAEREGQIYTFKEYREDGYIMTYEFCHLGGNMPDYMKFVERPIKKEEKVKKNINGLKVKCISQKHQIVIMHALVACGFAPAGLRTVEEYNRDFPWKEETGIGILYDKEIHTWDGIYNYITLDELLTLICEEQKPKYYKEKFIAAMKELAKEYIDGNHQWGRTCVLCHVVKEIKEINSGTFMPSASTCDICPWVVIKGKICNENDVKEDERACELVSWIKLYNDFKED